MDPIIWITHTKMQHIYVSVSSSAHRDGVCIGAEGDADDLLREPVVKPRKAGVIRVGHD